ncbi:recombinase family protein [Streptosporangium canum]
MGMLPHGCFSRPGTSDRMIRSRPLSVGDGSSPFGDVLTVSELFRLCRDLLDIHAVRDWCQARGVALRVLSGPLSNFHDLAAEDATTAVIINVITAVGQFQRDIQNELTVEGVAAAEAEGRYRGRPPALSGAQLEEVRSAFADDGTSIAALARAHGVSRAAIRTALTRRYCPGASRVRPCSSQPRALPKRPAKLLAGTANGCPQVPQPRMRQR